MLSINYNYKLYLTIVLVQFFAFSHVWAQRATNPVKVYTKSNKETGEVSFYAQNPGYSPYQVEVDFTEINNYQPTTAIPYLTVIHPDNKETYLFSLKPKDYGNMNFKVKYTFEHGDPGVTPQIDYEYLLPFTHGTKHKMAQGYGGKFSHADKYALDFAMDIGTPVTAVREGVVVDLYIDSDKGGPEKSYAGEGNYMLVYHPQDGSYATYSHLKKNGSLKKVGEKVKAGEHIAFSGNTGWSVGPHLHLEILKPEKLKLVTFPTRFKTNDRSVGALKEGTYYYAIHPGKPAFKAEANDEDKMISKGAADPKQVTKIETNNKIEVVDREDNGVIYFYLRNGFNSTKQVALKFDLENIKPIEKPNASVKVPANTEVFLFSAQIDNPAKPANFGFSISAK